MLRQADARSGWYFPPVPVCEPVRRRLLVSHHCVCARSCECCGAYTSAFGVRIGCAPRIGRRLQEGFGQLCESRAERAHFISSNPEPMIPTACPDCNPSALQQLVPLDSSSCHPDVEEAA